MVTVMLEMWLTICVLLRLSMCWFNGMDSQRWEGR